mmetsp:Transcript_48362/g.96372  ORF Transcript_48362/g.96372 Transcript_48362/m.96372 type:complete len:289 (-) Transcript_48362:335-1201(-)
MVADQSNTHQTPVKQLRRGTDADPRAAMVRVVICQGAGAARRADAQPTASSLAVWSGGSSFAAILGAAEAVELARVNELRLVILCLADASLGELEVIEQVVADGIGVANERHNGRPMDDHLPIYLDTYRMPAVLSDRRRPTKNEECAHRRAEWHEPAIWRAISHGLDELSHLLYLGRDRHFAAAAAVRERQRRPPAVRHAAGVREASPSAVHEILKMHRAQPARVDAQIPANPGVLVVLATSRLHHGVTDHADRVGGRIRCAALAAAALPLKARDKHFQQLLHPTTVA